MYLKKCAEVMRDCTVDVFSCIGKVLLRSDIYSKLVYMNL